MTLRQKVWLMRFNQSIFSIKFQFITHGVLGLTLVSLVETTSMVELYVDALRSNFTFSELWALSGRTLSSTRRCLILINGDLPAIRAFRQDPNDSLSYARWAFLTLQSWVHSLLLLIYGLSREQFRIDIHYLGLILTSHIIVILCTTENHGQVLVILYRFHIVCQLFRLFACLLIRAGLDLLQPAFNS